MAKRGRVIIPIDKKDLERYGIDEKAYQFYTERDLFPYRSSSGNIKWLTKAQYRVRLAKDLKRKKHKKRRYRIKKVDGQILTFEKILFGIGIALFLLLGYYIARVIGLF